MDGFISDSTLSGPGFRSESLRERGLLPESRGLVRVEPTSARDVLQKVAEHSRHIPPPDDLLQVTASAARFALTNLDSAKEIAREVRATQAKLAASLAASFAEITDRREAAEALGA